MPRKLRKNIRKKRATTLKHPVVKLPSAMQQAATDPSLLAQMYQNPLLAQRVLGSQGGGGLRAALMNKIAMGGQGALGLDGAASSFEKIFLELLV